MRFGTFRARSNALTFILVHGAWHAADCWTHVVSKLRAAGHKTVARDRPGFGKRAILPKSYAAEPFNLNAFAAEPSPVATVTFSDSVEELLSSCLEAQEPVILVGHSSGAPLITAAAERRPDLCRHLVYLAGFLPATGATSAEDFMSVENDHCRALAPLLIGDPTKTGALRLNWESSDLRYRADLHSVFCEDLEASEHVPRSLTLTPDDPFQLSVVPATHSSTRWGTIPRSYIRTTTDRALLPSLQDRFVTQADQLSSAYRTKVYPLHASHSPFLSQPDALCDILLDIARETSNEM